MTLPRQPTSAGWCPTCGGSGTVWVRGPGESWGSDKPKPCPIHRPQPPYYVVYTPMGAHAVVRRDGGTVSMWAYRENAEAAARKLNERASYEQ